VQRRCRHTTDRGRGGRRFQELAPRYRHALCLRQSALDVKRTPRTAEALAGSEQEPHVL
jgi:hypothetical protein